MGWGCVSFCFDDGVSWHPVWLGHGDVLSPKQGFTIKGMERKKKCLCEFINIRGNVSTVLRHGQAFSPIYRFSLSDGTIVSAHTKSKLVRSPATNEPQLYMSLHILQRYVSLSPLVSEGDKSGLHVLAC